MEHEGARRRLLLPHRPAAEMVGVVGLYLLYEVSRGLVAGERPAALAHAAQVVSVERHLHVFVEGSIQDGLGELPGLLTGLSYFYVGAHLVAAAATLAWLYVVEPMAYARTRTALTLASFAALIGYAVYPVMPPRLAATGLDDSVREHTPVNFGSALFGHLYNPYAAVPSMHFGFALVVGFLLVRYGRHLALRAAGAAYPAAVLLAIVSTGNHYFLDALAGALVVSLAWLATSLLLHPGGERAAKQPTRLEVPGRVPSDVRRAT